jgi:hypothetical protein
MHSRANQLHQKSLVNSLSFHVHVLYHAILSFCSNIILLLQQSLKLSGYRIADLSSFRFSSDIASSDALVNCDLRRLVNFQRKLGQAQGVLEHHAHGKYGCDGVYDALAGDVRCGTCTKSAIIAHYHASKTYREWARRCRST